MEIGLTIGKFVNETLNCGEILERVLYSRQSKIDEEERGAVRHVVVLSDSFQTLECD